MKRLKDAYSILHSKYKENEALLGRTLAIRSNLERQLTELGEDSKGQVHQLHLELQQVIQQRDQLHAEHSSMHQKILKASDEIATVTNECQAKTQEMNQCKEEGDIFRAQVHSLQAY